jgi:predicted transglutaminase-like cysteine proteinase
MGISTQSRGIGGSLLLAAALLLGCASLPISNTRSFYYFGAPEPGDPWSRKIEGWQLRQVAADGPVSARDRERAEHSAVSAAALGSDLGREYASFRSDQQRALARRVAEWIQSESVRHYRADGPVDHWATLQETLAQDGDDCDGLELLVYKALLDLGFRRDQVYRAVVYRKRDGQHHMVTFWFEDASDPWVIDPTGAMTYGMPRMSELPEWAPLRVFSETRDFVVRKPSSPAASETPS